MQQFNLLTVKKHESKLELANRGLNGQGKKEDLVNRLTKSISEILDNAEKHEFTAEGATISAEIVK